MHTIDDLHFRNRTVIMRVDFNVPIKDGKVQDDTRIKAALPSIRAITEGKAKLVLLSHLGRPLKDLDEKGKIQKAKYSLEPIAEHLSSLLDQKVHFSPDTIGESAINRIEKLQSGDIIIMENTRFHKGEEKGDKDFAKALSELGDIYVNDAFGAAHREHASTATIARFFKATDKAAGYLLQEEVHKAQKAIQDAEHPMIAIVGGAKVSDKIELIDEMIEKADHIIIGGGMAYTFIKAKGGKVGNSLVEDEKLDMAKELLRTAIAEHTEIHLPIDSVAAESFSEEADYKVINSDEIPDSWMGLDIGPEALKEFTKVILKGKTIIWNGPMGVFEMEPFSKGTYGIAKAVADATTNNNAFSLVGGGDSVNAINRSGKANQISHISTGGGALLELLEGKKLPGIAALED